MKQPTIQSKRKSRLILFLLLLTVSVSFVLTACTAPAREARGGNQNSGSGNGLGQTITATDPAQEENTAPVVIEQEVEPLAQEDLVLSAAGYGSKGALADEDLSLADMLLYAVQDEYLAHGEYTEIIEVFGSQAPYSNIVRSEESHIALLQQLYSAYDLTLPEDTSAGYLAVPESLLASAQIGVQAEIDNIAMYELFLTYDLPDPVNDTFITLKTASESHLVAFEKQVDRLS